MCVGKIIAKTDGVQVSEKWLLGREQCFRQTSCEYNMNYKKCDEKWCIPANSCLSHALSSDMMI